ncbi:uncharacterized protein B0I36DRAFT_255688, partial [Microdochium trichocladiopsis]
LLGSCVFSQADIFKHTPKIVLTEGRGPLQVLGLPIPPIVVADRIDQLRQESIKNVITVLHNLLIYLRDSRTACSFECSSILLGALTKELRARCFLPSQPDIPLV